MTEPDDPRSEDAFLKGAYGLSDIQSAMAFYSEWADDYDDRMESVLGYIAPRLMAERFAAALPDRDATILDVGCGTGLTSHYLATQGFGVFDGLDLNPEMLRRAEARGLYRDLIRCDITRPIPLDTGAYGGIISSGTFTLGHVGSEPVPELARILAPGGILGCSVHREIWQRDGFADRFAELEGAGVLETLAQIPGEFFRGYGDTALYCIFRKAGP